MASFGPCSEPSCTENSTRLFDCAHHCMKLLCLQHLIEHDQLMNSNGQCVNNLRLELEQLWIMYSTEINETKLYWEFEQRLTKHQQLVQEVIHRLGNDSLDIEQYEITLEKVKTYIEQEKQSNQYSSESPSVIKIVKIEPVDESSSIEQPDLSSVTNPTSMKSTNNINSIMSKQKGKYPSLKKISGICPFWLDGAFGLTQENHGMYLCSYEKYHHVLYRHLIKAHALTSPSARKICHAIYNNEDPCGKILFRPNDIVIDRIHHYQCPFSIYNHRCSIVQKSIENSCRRKKPLLTHLLRGHLIRFHQMTVSNANELLKKLKINSKTFSS